jgi:hypothetical protein
MVGGYGVGFTVTVRFCTAFGFTPLAAVNVTVKGDPAVVNGVPLKTPVVAFRLAHDGKPVALKVGAGKPVAVTVKLPATPTEKMALLALVIVGATDGADRKARRYPSEPARYSVPFATLTGPP